MSSKDHEYWTARSWLEYDLKTTVTLDDTYYVERNGEMHAIKVTAKVDLDVRVTQFLQYKYENAKKTSPLEMEAEL